MRKSIRALLAAAAVSLALLPAAAFVRAAEPETQTLTAAVQVGSQNYINNIKTRSVWSDGHSLIVCDEGNVDVTEGYLYFYTIETSEGGERAELAGRYQYGGEYFNPRAVLKQDNFVYCLNRGQLLKLALDERGLPVQTGAEVVDSYVQDFHFAEGVLYTMTYEQNDLYQINSYATGAKVKLYHFVKPVKDAPNFATDGTDFYYYETGAENDPGLYVNGERKGELPSVPTRLGLAGDTLVVLSEGRLSAVDQTTLEVLPLGGETASFEVWGDKIWTVDQNRIARYTLSGGALSYDGFSLKKEDGLSRPAAMARSQDGQNLILDTTAHAVLAGDRRISLPNEIGIADDDGKTVPFAGARYLASAGGRIYVANADTVVALNSLGEFETSYSGWTEGTLSDGSPKTIDFTSIRAICASVNGDLYLSANGRIFVKERNGDSFRPYWDLDAEALAVSNRNNRLYALSAGVIRLFGEDRTVSVPGARSFAVDFQNQIFALTGEGLLRISETAQGTSETTGFQITRSQLLDCYGSTFDGMFLQDQTGELYLLDEQLSLVFSVDKEETGVALASEIPELAITVDPLDKQLGAPFSLARIGGYPSTLLYPASEKIQPPAGTVGRLTELTAGTEVYVLEWVFDRIGRYAFVCVPGEGEAEMRFGFLLDTNLEMLSPGLPDIEEGVTGFSSEVYKYPERADVFLADRLEKGASVRLIEVPMAGWVKVSYRRGEETVTGYMRRSALIQNFETSVDERKNAQTVGIDNRTPLYERADLSSPVIGHLPDGRRVKIISRTGAFSYVETDEHVFGYIENRFLVEEGFSNSQRIGLILLGSCLVLGILSVLIRKKLIH